MSDEAVKAETPKLKCIYGNDVVLKNLRTDKETTYRLVTFNQEVLKENLISNYTEIGKAIWAKHEGDEVEIEITGKTTDRYRIVKIVNTPKPKKDA